LAAIFPPSRWNVFHTLFGSFWDDYSLSLSLSSAGVSPDQTDSAGRRFPHVEPLRSCCCFDVLFV
jgi:hypothetical protein